MADTPPSSTSPSVSSISTPSETSSSSGSVSGSTPSLISASSSFVVAEAPSPTEHDGEDDEEEGEVDSLPSIGTEELDEDDDDGHGDDAAQKEWERNLQQLQLLLTMVLVPFMGKYFGRKFAYWSWARYMEWAHGIEVRWTNKRAFKVAGAVEAAATL